MDWDDFLVDCDEATLDELAAEDFFLSEFGEDIDRADCD
jgi:hypothetical protein